MGRFQTLDWGSSVLQRRLDRESAATGAGGVATMEVSAGENHESPAAADDEADANDDVILGPYRCSPLQGLHFMTTDDTAAS